MTLATAALAPAYHPGSWDTFFTLTEKVRAPQPDPENTGKQTEPGAQA